MSIERLFIANRGEVAVRILRTCRRLGVAAIAAVAPDDRSSLHARQADGVGPVPSYLDGEALVRAATDGGADALHPGWGFLAESADFAESVRAAGLTWIGPPPEAMRLSGDKLEAKRLAALAGIPTLPAGSPDEIGLPLLVKASAGGGGRGMRVVRDASELDPALDAARREALAAFGDDRVFCEPLVERARHVEVQVLGDLHGRVVALGERDCSIQRRHQKILEEGPAWGIGDDLRTRLCEASVALAERAGYESAGTVEFLVSDGEPWFMELNARLQVEHPVTELVTGLDLVEEQLRIAAGEPLESTPRTSGHAVEVRLYAEDPLTFLPQTGRIRDLAFPDVLRIDAGVEQGDEVTGRYDPLIAKLVAAGDTREQAFDTLGTALRETRVGGLTTNLPFLRWLVDHPRVRAGEIDTRFLADHPPFSRRREPMGSWSGYWRLGRAGEPPPPQAPPPAGEPGRHGHGGHARGAVSAPMPGRVIRLLVEEGQQVAARQSLVVLEAMKMETPLASPFDAVVRRILVAEGDQVSAGAVLVELEE